MGRRYLGNTPSRVASRIDADRMYVIGIRSPVDEVELSEAARRNVNQDLRDGNFLYKANVGERRAKLINKGACRGV